MKYIHYNEKNGKILGIYAEDAKNIPLPNTKVSDNDWKSIIDNKFNRVNAINNMFDKFDFRSDNEKINYLRRVKIKEITKQFDNDAKLIDNSLPHVMSSWRKQEDSARKYITDNSYSTPFIDALLISRGFGETKDELVNKIIDNADKYEIAYAAILGKFQNKIKAIELATTITELEKIVWK